MVDTTARVVLFGRVGAFEENRQAVSFPTAKCRSLLTFLALHAGVEHPRERLTSVLWPETSSEVARSRLNVTVHLLRRTLEDATPAVNRAIVTDRETLTLDPDGIDIDTDRFLSLVDKISADLTKRAQVEHLEEVLQVYRAPLAIGLTDPWLQPWRTNFQHAFLDATLTLAHFYEEQGHVMHAARCLRNALLIEGTSMEAAQALAGWFTRLGGAGRAAWQGLNLGVEPAKLGETDALAAAIMRWMHDSSGPGLGPWHGCASILRLDDATPEQAFEVAQSTQSFAVPERTIIVSAGPREALAMARVSQAGLGAGARITTMELEFQRLDGVLEQLEQLPATPAGTVLACRATHAMVASPEDTSWSPAGDYFALRN